LETGRKVDGVVEAIKGLCKVVSVSESRVVIEVERTNLIALCDKLKSLGFDHVKGVTGVDYPNKNVIEVFYYIGSYSVKEYGKLIVELKISLPRENPETPSLVKIWPSCEYSERETYEMFGVTFKGHPKLEVMLLPEELEGVYPLRKDFKIPEEGIEA